MEINTETVIASVFAILGLGGAALSFLFRSRDRTARSALSDAQAALARAQTYDTMLASQQRQMDRMQQRIDSLEVENAQLRVDQQAQFDLSEVAIKSLQDEVKHWEKKYIKLEEQYYEVLGGVGKLVDQIKKNGLHPEWEPKGEL